MEKIELLRDGLAQIGIQADSLMLERFETYYQMLIEWNEKMNLTAITQEEDVIIKHFIDSVLVVKAIDFNRVHSLIDIGTGAGFPGLPLKIVFPQLKVTLMDSLNKRIHFLEAVTQALKLQDVECKHSRAEDLAKEANYRENYDLVLSRAVSHLSTLSEYCLPFANISGFFVSYKSADCEEELNAAKEAIRILGGQIKTVATAQLPFADITRTYVCVEKIGKTPKTYPRKAGTPTKSPLK